MKIINVKRKPVDTQYLKDRDVLWCKKRKEYKNQNIPLWNGNVYFLEKIDGDNLYIGLFEYKDLVFLEEYGIDYIWGKYNFEQSFTYINVQVLIWNNNKCLLGTQQKIGYIELIPIGGTLRVESGKTIKNLEDIKNYAKEELEVETKIEVESDKIVFIDMIVSKNICTFLFEYVADDLQQNILNTGEFDGEVMIDKKEFFRKKGYKPSARLASILDYLKAKWKIN